VSNDVRFGVYEQARRKRVIKDKRNIIIIDDQSTGRAIIEKIIFQIADNIEIISFSDPAAALNWLDEYSADLIVTDYLMPEMNGIEVIKNIRSKSEYENVPIIMVSINSERSVRYEALEAGASAFLNRPIDQIECRTTCRNLLQLHEQQLIIQDRADWLARQVAVATKQLVEREIEALICLAKAGEYRDEGTGNHVIRMAKYSRFIAEATGKLSPQECKDLEYAAPMHDIGKIGIPDAILLKNGKLDLDEWTVMKTHSAIGHEILSSSSSKYMKIGAVIALNHHERVDGNGYPNGLKGEEIPFIARVVAVADVYDALVSERPYKKAWSHEDAIAYIQEQAGTHLDTVCVDAFFKRLDDVNLIRSQYSDD